MKNTHEGFSAQPVAPVTAADSVLRYSYGGQLEAAAESFLLSAFEQSSNSVLCENGAPSVLVAAAMHIMTRTAWTQPTDEQVKAAMYLRTQAYATPRD